jgi:signal transduction histidine kinase
MNTKLELRVRERTAELHALNSQLKALSKRVIDTQESERRSLARELHDEIGQALTGLNMLLHRAGNDATPEARARIREGGRVVADLMQRIRKMSFDLRPAVLDDLGLCVAVRSHIDSFSKQTGMKAVFECLEVKEQDISAEVKITAFRCVQEGLTNVVRHSKAARAVVELRSVDSRLVIEIADSGCGFDVEKWSHSAGTGLNGMRERVKLAGGKFNVKSSPNRGTRITIHLPLAKRRKENGV